MLLFERRGVRVAIWAGDVTMVEPTFTSVAQREGWEEDGGELVLPEPTALVSAGEVDSFVVEWLRGPPGPSGPVGPMGVSGGA
jgi:hypothetical protein